jgi:hypothetical protein
MRVMSAPGRGGGVDSRTPTGSVGEPTSRFTPDSRRPVCGAVPAREAVADRPAAANDGDAALAASGSAVSADSVPATASGLARPAAGDVGGGRDAIAVPSGAATIGGKA